nr:MAG TPA: hypothetical protein [Caudoviricetes sp.]
MRNFAPRNTNFSLSVYCVTPGNVLTYTRRAFYYKSHSTV